MSQSIRALPPAWAAIAYALLGLGLFFVLGFLIRYMSRLPWAASPEGRHLVAVSANVGAFFALYLALTDRKSTRLNSSHITRSRMPSSA